MIETQFDIKIKILCSDNRGEHLSSTFSSYLDQCGIMHQTTYPSTTKQNEVAEQNNKHIL